MQQATNSLGVARLARHQAEQQHRILGLFEQTTYLDNSAVWRTAEGRGIGSEQLAARRLIDKVHGQANKGGARTAKFGGAEAV